MRILLRVLAVLAVLAPIPASAQRSIFVPVHHHLVAASTTQASVAVIPAFNRSYLGLINDGSNVAYCMVDGTTTATVGNGIRLAAAGTTGDRIFFDYHVPQGPLYCTSTSGTVILVIEGR